MLSFRCWQIPPFNPRPFLPMFSCQTICLSCGYIFTEGFKTGTILNFRHITSPGYIVMEFILRPWNGTICGLVEVYNSYITKMTHQSCWSFRIMIYCSSFLMKQSMLDCFHQSILLTQNSHTCCGNTGLIFFFCILCSR